MVRLNPGETIVKEGTFLYDEQVPCRLLIVHSKVQYGTGDYQDPPELANDQDCDAFYIKFSSTTDVNHFNSGSGPFSSLSEAMTYAEAAPGLGHTVRWIDQPEQR